MSDVRLVELDPDAAHALASGHALAALAAAGFPRREDVEAARLVAKGAATYLVVADGLVVGTCGTHGPPGNDGALELGWGLVASARGHGIGTEAVARLLAAVRAAHPGTPLVAHTEWRLGAAGLVADSPASEAILRAAGFAPEAVPAAPGYRAWRSTVP